MNWNSANTAPADGNATSASPFPVADVFLIHLAFHCSCHILSREPEKTEKHLQTWETQRRRHHAVAGTRHRITWAEISSCTLRCVDSSHHPASFSESDHEGETTRVRPAPGLHSRFNSEILTVAWKVTPVQMCQTLILSHIITVVTIFAFSTFCDVHDDFWMGPWRFLVRTNMLTFLQQINVEIFWKIVDRSFCCFCCG